MTRPVKFPSPKLPAAIALAAIALAAIAVPAVAQEDALSYQLPPQVLVDIIDAPPSPFVAVSPDQEWLLLLQQPGLPPIEEVAQPELRLAGLRINPRDNGPSRVSSLDRLTFRRLSDGKELPVTGIPEGGRITGVSWSPDGKRIAFVVTRDERLTLWAAELKDGKAGRVTPEGMALNGVYGRPYDWLADGKSLVAKALPAGRGEPPAENLVPGGPVIQENLGKKAPARTFQDLLQNPYDESLFDHYCTSQVVKLTLDGKAVPLGGPAVFRSMDPSPDGKYLMVQMIRHPYSYSLQESDFPRRIEIWDLDGELAYLVADLPLQDQVPISFGSVPVGRRSVEWRDDKPAQLVWTEALDGGDGGVEAEERDRVFTLDAPFTGEPLPLITLGQRYGGVTWGDDDLAFVSSWWWKTRNVKVWRIKPGDRDFAPVIVQDRSWQDRYNDPGQPLTHRNRFGRQVILTADGGRSIFLNGEGASPEGDRPFLDRYDLETGKAERLFRSEAPHYESPVELIDPGKLLLLTRRESQTEPPNYFLRDLKNGKLDPKTFFPDPTPQLAGISKELIQYERSDGVKLTGTLYLPAGYDKDRDGPLPCLMWAYPTEFKSADDAGQVTDSPYRFTRVGWFSPMLYLTQGYAVLDDPTMPIVGEGEEEPNDTFIEQLVASAQAAVDEVVRRGVVDPERVAIGGHSYGAFMTANLLAHSDLFRAGLPRSGAYNRTLTPFGFQSEERTLWEAPEVYFTMSPFMHADKIDEPILLVHGEADNNSGTFPMQSERMYGAIKGHGGTARLVMLPHESHGYRARESVMHLLWETVNWLDRYVKNAEPRTFTTPEVEGS
ncbi:MAG: prolyl oligopeptidase family serine peptidase [Candidatus Krumholzibacteriia bacterium]